jgi:Zn-dependent M28 family amino/carboxypeptidase
MSVCCVRQSCSRSWTTNRWLALIVVVITVAAVGCGGEAVEELSTANGITADDLAKYTRELSDDALLGRGTGGEGQAATLEYLQAAYERIGLAPMGDSALPGSPPGSKRFLQEVALVGITADPATAALSFKGSTKSEALDLQYGSDFVTWTPEPEAVLDVSGDLVFVGYGVDAPEENWNDFGDMDMTGKILLVLVNDPPLEDQSRFGGTAMTYYGRYTYKFEEGACRGAAGVLLIHDTEAAGYGWNVVRGWIGEQLGLPPAETATPPVPMQGWVTWDTAERIIGSAGLDLDELAAAAARDGFRSVELGVAAAAHLETAIRTVTSFNVVGEIRGSDPELADEYIIYMAHWDHLGVGEPVNGDAIYNGARDNAIGAAAMLEIAGAWEIAQPAPRRSALFLATTGEEMGWLGANYYVEHPIVPLENTLAAINIDGLNTWGPTENLSVSGFGDSTLDDDLTSVLAEQGRGLVPDPEPEKGYAFRTDRYPFARSGVPALDTSCGPSFVGKPVGFAQQVWDDYTANHYHQPSDEFDPSWDFNAAVQDVEVLLQVGLRVSAADTWPEWRPGTEFKAARDAMLQDQKQ